MGVVDPGMLGLVELGIVGFVEPGMLGFAPGILGLVPGMLGLVVLPGVVEVLGVVCGDAPGVVPEVCALARPANAEIVAMAAS